MRIIDIIQKFYPDEVMEFNNAPWDYKVFGPMGVEDEMNITVHLHVGKVKKMYTMIFEITIHDEHDVDVIQKKMSTPKVKTL